MLRTQLCMWNAATILATTLCPQNSASIEWLKENSADSISVCCVEKKKRCLQCIQYSCLAFNKASPDNTPPFFLMAYNVSS